MRIFFYPDAGGCKVTVSEGYLEAFCEDHDDASLRGLTGVSFDFDASLVLRDVRVKDGTLDQWKGEGLKLLARQARAFALDQKPPRTSGLHRAVQSTVPTGSQVAEAKEPSTPPPSESRPKYLTSDERWQPGRYVIVRKRAAGA